MYPLGKSAVSYDTVRRWYCEFKSGSLSGQILDPSPQCRDQNIKYMMDMLRLTDTEEIENSTTGKVNHIISVLR